MSEESSDAPSNPRRASRFREHTNTNSTIRPPPDELWKDLGIDSLIDRFNAENEAPPTTARKSGRNTAPGLRRRSSDTIKNPQNEVGTGSVAAAQHEGAFGRLQRAWASMLGGVLGKRKAGAVDAQRDKAQQLLDQRKKAAEAAYHEAKELGLLPTPTVFVRPGMAAMSHNCATPVRPPRTPSLYRTPSKKDVQKQKRLSKRVSNLESKLASARKELHSVLHSDLPPVPPLPPAASQDSREHALPLEPSRSPPPIPASEPITSESEPEPEPEPEPDPRPPSSSRSLGNITKKRKARRSIDDAEYIAMPTDSEGDMDLLSGASEPELKAPLDKDLDSERTIKRLKSSASSASPRTKKAGRKPGPRMRNRGSRASLQPESEEATVTVVPDGVKVPLVPAIPHGVRGKKVVFKGASARHGDEDLYGGLEHEMF